MGTLVNALTVILGSILGLFISKGISKSLNDIINQAVGLSTVFIGIGGTMSEIIKLDNGKLATQDTLLIILSLVVGGVIGQLIDIDKKLNELGAFIEKVTNKFTGSKNGEKSKVAEGFVSATLVFCIGAMAIVGAIKDSVMGDPSVLYAKSIIDGITSVIFTASMGIGVIFSSVSILLYQGIITLIAKAIEPYLSYVIIGRMSAVGSILIFCIGLNFLSDKKINVANLLPAIFIPALLSFFM